MDELQKLKTESEQWRADHARWLADANSWTIILID